MLRNIILFKVTLNNQMLLRVTRENDFNNLLQLKMEGIDLKTKCSRLFFNVD